MGWLQVSAVICSFLGFGLLLTALASDHWVESASHTGLWQVCKGTLCGSFGTNVQDYIHATRAFMLMGAIAGTVSFFGLCVSFCRPFVGSVSTTKIAAIASFIAGSCALLAMTIFTAVYSVRYLSSGRWFEWSFTLGWVSGPLFLVTAGLAYKAHLSAPRQPHKGPSSAAI